MPSTPVTDPPQHPTLAAHVRLQKDRASDAHLLLHPEGAVELSETATAVVRLCDGSRRLSQIVETLAGEYAAPTDSIREDVIDVLRELAERGLIVEAAP